MKYAFISDIHGNAVALESVISDIHNRNVDEVFVLGDLCYRGPEPKRALDLVRSLGAKVIKGNADEWVVRGVRKGEVPDQALEMMNLERDWAVSQLDDQDIAYLKTLPTELKIKTTNNKLIHAFHATPNSLFEVVQQNGQLENIMTLPEASLYVYAHIHLPYVTYINGKCVANLGSVGLPFDGQPLSSYLIVEEVGNQLRVSIERVPYQVQDVMKQFEDKNYPNKELLKQVVAKGKNPNQL